MRWYLQPFLDEVRRGSDKMRASIMDERTVAAHYARMRSIKPWAQRLLVKRDLARKRGGV